MAVGRYTLHLTYERCRSPAGVPTLAFSVTPELPTMEAIRDAVHWLQHLAAEAHPGVPQMQMPSLDPAAYYLGDRAGNPHGALAALPWVAGTAKAVLWDRPARPLRISATGSNVDRTTQP